ncbi:MAG TPA: quinolinate synthase NadA [Caldisericia bacterium]|nr:quinolinate synthase NadA [Caldisericia bacterium]HPF48367.1 quinolinate synthase NadA [Caldisericia bacterium]HPI83454.1 quinolinate synthase NadA [Caldisericia bacterium]HPQ92820.1 quinolinate synthase NadA [Caldisericia bacterium]HRV74082.1 quinolinate synthase NadA [Caldisericia bacterium]
MDIQDIANEVKKLKVEKDILLLAHSYQPLEIQQMADFVGDSLELSKIARDSNHKKIMYAAVHFMAETASILSPEKQIMIANPDAGCPLADTITPEQVKEFKESYPNAPVVCYINSTAATKAEVDVICTSSNALKIIERLPDKIILFVPDKGLGTWLNEQTNKSVISWETGNCPTHWNAPVDKVKESKVEHPDALLVVHPESHPDIRALAHHVCGTSGMIQYVKENPGREFIIGTEVGMISRLQTIYPDVVFHKAAKTFICPNMKKTTPEILLESLQNETTIIKVDEDIAKRAKRAIERMYELTD